MKSQGIIIMMIVVINYFSLIVRVLLKLLKYVNRNVSLLNENIFLFSRQVFMGGRDLSVSHLKHILRVACTRVQLEP